MDSEIGLSVVDRFSHKFHEFLQESTPTSTFQDFIASLDPEFLGSTPIFRGDLMSRPADEIKFFDFIAWKGVEAEIGNIVACNKIYKGSDRNNRIEYTDPTDYSQTTTKSVYTIGYGNSNSYINYLFTGLLIGVLLKSIL